MNRITEAFKNKPIFMPYFPLGYPDLGTSIDVIEAMAKNGANLMEVGLSFSDPLADGPVTNLMFRFFGWFTRPIMARQLKRDLDALAAAIRVERPTAEPMQ